MCGICGVIRFDDQPVDPDALVRGNLAQRHRGPDHAGHWVDSKSGPAIGFGAVRLAVIDPAPCCHQPLSDPAGRYRLVFNGELYNYRALRSELGSTGYTFITQGDTEVVLAACARWGVDALTRLDGIWGLAFFDTKERTGFISRDRYGVKPLLYAVDDRSLSFASEMRGLSEMIDLDRTIDESSLIHLLTFGYVADPATIYERVRRLQPGYVLRFDARSAQEPEPWFRNEASHSLDEATIDYAGVRQTVRKLIADAVTRQRVADVPMGALLSGGLDSSIIVHHLAEASTRPVETFSVGYAGAASFDESRYARLVANRYDTRHHAVTLTDRDALATIPDILNHLGEPVGDSSIIPTALVSKFAASHVTVALSGDGGDELFGGYWRYLGHDALFAFERLPPVLCRRVIEPVLSKLESSKGSWLGNRVRQLRKLLRAEGGDPLNRHLAWSRILSPEAAGILASSSIVDECVASARRVANERTNDLDQRDHLNRVLAFDLAYQLPSDMLQKVDLASMMHSLEVRVPLLDPALVSYVRGLPSRYKVHRGLRRIVLVDAYRGLLPDEILDRPKQGFEIPFGNYLRGPLLSMFRDVVTPDVINSFGGVVSTDGVERLLDDHLARRGEHGDVLFAQLSLCWWRRAGG